MTTYTKSTVPAYYVYSHQDYTCQADAISGQNFVVQQVEKYQPDAESRVYPADPVKAQTDWGPAITVDTKAAVTPLAVIAQGQDFACPKPRSPTGWKWYYRYVTLQTWDQDPSLNLTWPDWSLPLRLKVKDDVINLGATVAEYRQSVHMFGSAARGVVDAWRAIRKLKFAKKRSMCSITSAHLIHDYGVAPLLSDVYDSYEALRLRLERPVYKRYHFRQKANQTSRQVSGSLGTYGTYDRTAFRNGTQDVTAHVELDMTKASMFTLGNPLEIAWELVPFSFVVDWLIPVGDTLIALDALKHVKSINGSFVRKEVHKQSTVTYVNSIAGPLSGTPGSVLRTVHSRTKFTSVPLPGLPRFNPRASVSTLLNALSLLVSVRGCRGVMPRFRKPDFRLGQAYTE